MLNCCRESIAWKKRAVDQRILVRLDERQKEYVRKVVRIQDGLEKLAKGIYARNSQEAPYKKTRIEMSFP